MCPIRKESQGKHGWPQRLALAQPLYETQRDKRGTSRAEIAAELRQIALLGTRLNGEQLGLSVRQGECLMEAADYIKLSGGIEQWLAKHAVDLGISGKSRSTSAKLLKLGRAGLKACQTAVAFVARHPERLMTARRQGVDYFVAALHAWNDRDKRLSTKPKRRRKADRERILLRRVQWLDDLLHRAIDDLEKAVVNGWRDNVLNSLKAEMETYGCSMRPTMRGMQFLYRKGVQRMLRTSKQMVDKL